MVAVQVQQLYYQLEYAACRYSETADEGPAAGLPRPPPLAVGWGWLSEGAHPAAALFFFPLLDSISTRISIRPCLSTVLDTRLGGTGVQRGTYFWHAPTLPAIPTR